jgi:hypothetical protein
MLWIKIAHISRVFSHEKLVKFKSKFIDFSFGKFASGETEDDARAKLEWCCHPPRSVRTSNYTPLPYRWSRAKINGPVDS